jgi:hypothetical protein
MIKKEYSDIPSSNDHAQFDEAKGHLQDWSRELINLKGRHGLDVDEILSIQELNMDRNATYARLEKMGLPTVLYRATSLLEFLAHSEEYLGYFDGGKIRLIVEPHSGKDLLPTIRMTDPVRDEIVEVLKDKTEAKVRDMYSVLIKEFIPFAYRVTVVVNSDQSILLEAAKPASSSFQLNGVPDYHVRRDPFLGTFCYDFNDPHLRRLLYQAIQKIPYLGTGQHKEFLEGYYEMIIAKRSKDASFQYYFDDYRRGKGFNA